MPYREVPLPLFSWPVLSCVCVKIIPRMSRGLAWQGGIGDEEEKPIH